MKLWKHHAAQPQADRINALARERGEPWLARYGGKISSEWFFSKSLQILEEAPQVYDAADRLIEAADWVAWRSPGSRPATAAPPATRRCGRRPTGSPVLGSSVRSILGSRNVVDDKMSRSITPIGSPAGSLTAEAAGWTGLLPGTPVAVANVDAHVSVPASGVTQPGRMVAVMGTSTCHLVLGSRPAVVEGMCGVVEDGILPGQFGFEAGQSARRRHLRLVRRPRRATGLPRRGAGAGIDVHRVLEREAARLRPGESGLVALDWWNGNRSVLVDADLSGLVIGATLATRAADIYRALIEATAFGTRLIIDAFEDAGVAIDEVVACGGLPERNRLLMQIYADVTEREFKVAASAQTPALGSAMFGAVAAGSARGGYDDIADATAAHGPDQGRVISSRPDEPRPSTTSCTTSTAGCTTRSAAARTTS